MNAKEYVEFMLKNYHGLKSDIEQLKLELEHFCGESEEDTIEGMSLKTGIATQGAQWGGVSDRTGRTALLYREANMRINSVSKKQLEDMLKTCELELRKLETAINGLEECVRKVISDVYISRMSWTQVCARHYISPNTLNRYRKKGIEELARAYGRAAIGY